MSRRSTSITIRDVARKAGVSVATVSRYINRNAPVSSEVAKRLEQVMTELNYVPHAAARHLASRKTRVVGLLLNNLHNDFFVPLLNGVEAVVRKNDYNLIIATYHANIRNQTAPPIGPHNTDGMLVFSDGLTDDDLIRLHITNFPMVLVHRTSPASVSIPSVTVDNIEVTRKLIEHFIKVHGKRRILFLRGPIHQEDSVLRERAYRSALQANGIPIDEDLILNGEFERDIAYEAMNEFLGNEAQVAFDAVFTGDDDAAIGVLKSLHEHGIQIPEEVAVIGFDDLGFAPFLNPPLTTVRAPTEQVGRIATERLFGILNDHPSDEEIILPTDLIIRRSCGCQQ
ncbi:MAG: LacI family transcriptional regulator [Anaerolineales bacterium]|nr:LacI family transcriptional regulator [Anaerolineae bacterium]PWB71629.1 MAG: LacI family transcriptional regulator [Anaerolineales bacterium]